MNEEIQKSFERNYSYHGRKYESGEYVGEYVDDAVQRIWEAYKDGAESMQEELETLRTGCIIQQKEINQLKADKQELWKALDDIWEIASMDTHAHGRLEDIRDICTSLVTKHKDQSCVNCDIQFKPDSFDICSTCKEQS